MSVIVLALAAINQLPQKGKQATDLLVRQPRFQGLSSYHPLGLTPCGKMRYPGNEVVGQKEWGKVVFETVSKTE